MKAPALLAVLDRQRHPSFPDVPVLKEILPEIDFVAWFGHGAEHIHRLESCSKNALEQFPIFAAGQYLALAPAAGVEAADTIEDLAPECHIRAEWCL